jgi:hypothetical protein
MKFAYVIALPTMEPPNAAGNVLLFARSLPLELPEELPAPTWRFSPEYDLAHAWDNRFEPEAGAEPFTDRRCPTDRWARPVKNAARAELREIFWEAKPR